MEGGEPDGGKVEKSRDEGAERVEMRNAKYASRTEKNRGEDVCQCVESCTPNKVSSVQFHSQVSPDNSWASSPVM